MGDDGAISIYDVAPLLPPPAASSSSGGACASGRGASGGDDSAPAVDVDLRNAAVNVHLVVVLAGHAEPVRELTRRAAEHLLGVRCSRRERAADGGDAAAAGGTSASSAAAPAAAASSSLASPSPTAAPTGALDLSSILYVWQLPTGRPARVLHGTEALPHLETCAASPLCQPIPPATGPREFRVQTHHAAAAKRLVELVRVGLGDGNAPLQLLIFNVKRLAAEAKKESRTREAQYWSQGSPRVRRHSFRPLPSTTDQPAAAANGESAPDAQQPPPPPPPPQQQQGGDAPPAAAEAPAPAASTAAATRARRSECHRSLRRRRVPIRPQLQVLLGRRRRLRQAVRGRDRTAPAAAADHLRRARPQRQPLLPHATRAVAPPPVAVLVAPHRAALDRGRRPRQHADVLAGQRRRAQRVLVARHPLLGRPPREAAALLRAVALPPRAPLRRPEEVQQAARASQGTIQRMKRGCAARRRLGAARDTPRRAHAAATGRDHHTAGAPRRRRRRRRPASTRHRASPCSLAVLASRFARADRLRRTRPATPRAPAPPVGPPPRGRRGAHREGLRDVGRLHRGAARAIERSSASPPSLCAHARRRRRRGGGGGGSGGGGGGS